MSLTAVAAVAAPSSLAGTTGAISGTVTEAAAPHAPIAGIEVCAYARPETSGPEEPEPPCAITGASGEYTIAGLSSGAYTIEFSVPFKSQLNYVTQYYDDRAGESTADPVNVNAPATTAGIDAQLVVGGEISGTVTDAKTGAGIEGALVCAGVSGGELGGCALSGASGAYTVRGLATGDYQVFFFDPGYQLQFYDGKGQGSEADLVAVVQGATTTGIDAALQPGSTRAPPPSPGSGARAPTAPGVADKTIPQDARPFATVLSRRLAVRHHSVRVRLACAHARCVGRISLLQRIDSGKLQLVRGLAFGSFSIAPGHVRTVTIHLVGRKLPSILANARRHPLRLELELSVRGGNSAAEHVLVN